MPTAHSNYKPVPVIYDYNRVKKNFRQYLFLWSSDKHTTPVFILDQMSLVCDTPM